MRSRGEYRGPTRPSTVGYEDELRSQAGKTLRRLYRIWGRASGRRIVGYMSAIAEGRLTERWFSDEWRYHDRVLEEYGMRDIKGG